ncbi:hypothetical protein L249_6636 [Ophiocordyceps polyrhachis-furcata BCC 54312]|uniref:CBM20 domain-containing protein n=1 Tax=Ophiocordyceps polyrhachis-furcata BCC 54312 TaxID=1330021 RepID=A0A367LKZ1_9HYPO|nr:hypothetical protein L249_6636 [Ophiocordyceps polyrhachis-furcata BCC 54312]
MRSTVFLSLSLVAAVSALDQVALAKGRISELQSACTINWEDRPASGDGRLLDRNTEPNITVYVERYIDKSYINAGLSEDTFTLSKSTTVIKDITESLSISAHSSQGFQAGVAASFHISRGSSRTKQTSISDGSFKSDTWERIETCQVSHVCRFETWTYHAHIQGRCEGSPCEMRAVITGPGDKPLTRVVYIPQQMPSGVDAIQQSIEAELTNEYCIDWSNPPTRNGFEQDAGKQMTIYRSPARLLKKPHRVTVHARRISESEQASTGSGNSSFHVTRSTVTTQSSTSGWSVGAQVSYQFSSTMNSFITTSAVFHLSTSKDVSKQETNGGWISDGFSIRSTCKSSHICAFETWTLYAHVSGICENTWHIPIQRRCEFDVPIFNRVGEPYAYFAMVAYEGNQKKGFKQPAAVKPSPGGEDVNKRRPKAVGAIENLCLLDNYEYWGIQEKKYLDFETDTWIDDPNRAAPENLEYCQSPIPELPPMTESKCYKDEIWAASLLEPEKEQERDGEDGPTANGRVLIDDADRKWCQLDNNQWYNEEADQYWSDETQDGVARPAGTPKPRGLEKCTGVTKANGNAILDDRDRLWCQLDNGRWYNPEMKLYWSDKTQDGVAKPGEPEPQDLDKCDRTTALNMGTAVDDTETTADDGTETTADDDTETTADDGTEERQAVRATGQAELDGQGQLWCALNNGEWYNKESDMYFSASDNTYRARREDEAKPQALDQCTTTNQDDDGCETATSVEVTFRLAEATQFGQTVKMVGNTDGLGNWNPSRAVALDASEYEHPHRPMWKGAAMLEAGKKIEYKYIKVEQDGRVVWEAGSSRVYEVPVSCDSTAERLDQWQK